MIYYHSTNNKINKTIKKLIMKRAILSVLLLFAFLTGFAQNRNICRLGITYDISQSDHWGKNKPVITSVIPYSPAELAGVKTNDIIIAIDGVQTTDISSEEIGEMLNPAGKNEVLLTIGNNSKLETAINESIEKELTKKGMTVDTDRPDIIVQTFYFFDKNPNYKGANKILVEKEPIYRYNFNHSKMETFPFLNSMSAEAEAEYLLQFGFRLIDQRDVPGRILWECEANELLEDSYRLDEYARIHAPLMCMQYPYVKYQRNVPFKVNQKTYNYTGLSYDIDRMEQIADVDKNSPAYAAGLRPRDIVEKINDQKMNYTAEEFSAAYKGFITNTMKYRDPKTQFTDANGFKRCMFWDTFKYPQVADAIQKPGNKTAYSYLYYYAPYINPSGNNACTFDIKRGKNKMEIIVRPTIRRSVTVEVK